MYLHSQSNLGLFHKRECQCWTPMGHREQHLLFPQTQSSFIPSDEVAGKKLRCPEPGLTSDLAL